ncbi:outer membrane protein, nutrient binding [Filimonas lacunae]|nr:outer membrane protein, nutrient binding [Filimonas lacunae]
MALNGVYDGAQSSYYTSGTTEVRGYPFGAANIEQGDARGEDVVNIQAFFQITYQATYNSTSANCVAMWKGLYELINKANIGINGFRSAASSGILTSAVASQYEAECRFLRALAHHEALIQYARPYLDGNGTQVGVPYRETPITSSTAVSTLLNTPRMRVDSVYIKILADLDYAEANLPETIASYRATKAAAIALKMRVKLHMGDWAGVITEGAKLVPATVDPTTPTSVKSPIGNWALTASPDGPFANNNSTESIFSVKNDALDAPSTNGALSRMFGAASLTGRGLVSVSPIIYNNAGWLCSDKRRSALLVSGTNSAGTQSWFTTKYRDYVSYSDYAPQIRYAEVLLTLAEAEARNSTTFSTRALNLLNVVRNRSLAIPATEAYTSLTLTSKNALIAAILLERRIEFLCEGKRWSDIHRLAKDADFSPGGIPAKATNGTAGLANFVCGGGYTPGQAAIAYSDYRFVWPIPATEITQNPVIAQNPLY